jgi:hypothetical protein
MQCAAAALVAGLRFVPLELLKRAARFVNADGGSVKARVLRSGFWVGLSNVGQPRRAPID